MQPLKKPATILIRWLTRWSPDVFCRVKKVSIRLLPKWPFKCALNWAVIYTTCKMTLTHHTRSIFAFLLNVGAPWLPAVIPMRGVMTIGFDVAKDSATKGRMYGCLVATMDLKQAANFYSAVSTYSDSETLSTQFGLNVVNALHAFDKQHGTLPSRIVIYRGGVGEGDITYVRDVEVKTIERQVQSAYDQRGMKLQMAFIVVTKKINTRIFAPRGNPGPGTVVDDVITLPER